MMEFLSEYTLALKAAHIIFAIFWCAGLLMLPRFFVYHTETEIGSEADKRWTERETRLLKIIMLPGMIFTWVLGISLIFAMGYSHESWLMVKFSIVVVLSVFHMMMASWRTQFAKGIRKYSNKTYRLVNEIPSLAIIIIVIMVVVKPF